MLVGTDSHRRKATFLRRKGWPRPHPAAMWVWHNMLHACAGLLQALLARRALEKRQVHLRQEAFVHLEFHFPSTWPWA